MNTTETFWDVDGVSLNTYAYNISTLGGSRMGVPPLRGQNIALGTSPGQAFVPKIPDSRVISLMMWVQGSDADGKPYIPKSPDDRSMFHDNWKMLKRLFWHPERQMRLTKRWFENAGAPRLKSATALCELAGTMDPTMQGPNHATFNVDLLLADPYFYGPQKTLSIARGASAIAVNDGDARAEYSGMKVIFTGPLVNPSLINSTLGCHLGWTGTLTSGVQMVVDCANFTADINGQNVISGLNHGGDRAWFPITTGQNNLFLSDGPGSSGSVKVIWQDPYL